MKSTCVVIGFMMILAAYCFADPAAVPVLEQEKEIVGAPGNRVVLYKHKAVEGMDSPGYVKQGFEHRVTFMEPAAYKADKNTLRPLIISLHGFGDKADDYTDAVSRWFADSQAFVMAPNDPLGTWFYGYSDQLPVGSPDKGMVVNYTERRILFYLEHFKALYPIDPNRIYLNGGSMGGTGSISLALRYPQIFAGADTKKGAVNRQYCHWKKQCETIWGRFEAGVKNNEGVNVWDWQNMAWYMASHHDKATWIRTLHGREDTSIPYRQVAGPPEAKPMSFYKALETYGIGHQCIWDCSSHGMPDPERPALDAWWDPFTDDPVCFLRLNLSFPAFSSFSANNNPGTGTGDAVGNEQQLGDNTYDGDARGGLNRFLRWNSKTIVDRPDAYAIDLQLTTRANGYKGQGPETVDVTLRRLQQLTVKPGMSFSWSTTAGQAGTVTIGDNDLLTIPGVKVMPAWTTLTVKAEQ